MMVSLFYLQVCYRFGDWFFCLKRPLPFSRISCGGTSPLCLHTFARPVFFPSLTSRLLAQQQHKPSWTSQPTIAHALATHMNANMLSPITGTILTWGSALWMTFLNIMNMAVAMMLAAVVVRALRKAKMAMGKVAQRVYILRGVTKTETKQVHAPVRKKANIQREATRTSESAEMTFAGRATWNLQVSLSGTGESKEWAAYLWPPQVADQE